VHFNKLCLFSDSRAKNFVWKFEIWLHCKELIHPLPLQKMCHEMKPNPSMDRWSFIMKWNYKVHFDSQFIPILSNTLKFQVFCYHYKL
jgi:hypothetical protein